jgi:hypothetical protein
MIGGVRARWNSRFVLNTVIASEAKQSPSGITRREIAAGAPQDRLRSDRPLGLAVTVAHSPTVAGNWHSYRSVKLPLVY